jgi:hypothetical protein
MVWDPKLTDLRNALSDLYERVGDIKRITDDAGVPSKYIDFKDSAVNVWHNVLLEAQQQQKLQRIIDIARQEYPEDISLNKAADTYAEQNIHYDDLQRSGQRIPDLLPYLPDREIQDSELGNALQQVNPNSPRPIICLIHGDEYQCHDMFIRRLEQVSLTRLLALDPNRTKITVHSLSWPSHFRDVDDLHKHLRMNLSNVILNKSFAELDEVNNWLAKIPGPVIIHTRMFTNTWKAYGDKVLTGFLEFWQNWPDLAPGQQLFVFWSMQYQMEKQGLFFWQKRRFDSANNKDIEMTLSTVSFSDFDRFIGVVLPKLEGITRTDAENWAHLEDTKCFCRGHDVLVEIRRIFEEWESGKKSDRIPMESFAQGVIDNILYKYTTVKEGRI